MLGVFGELHPDMLKAMDLHRPGCRLRALLEAIPPARKKTSRARRWCGQRPAAGRRDFAFVLASDALASEVVRAAQSADKALISNVSVFDIFEGPSLGAGRKSLAIEVTLQPREKTLTDEEIEAVSAKVVAAVKKATGGEIRA